MTISSQTMPLQPVVRDIPTVQAEIDNINGLLKAGEERIKQLRVEANTVQESINRQRKSLKQLQSELKQLQSATKATATPFAWWGAAIRTTKTQKTLAVVSVIVAVLLTLAIAGAAWVWLAALAGIVPAFKHYTWIFGSIGALAVIAIALHIGTNRKGGVTPS